MLFKLVRSKRSVNICIVPFLSDLSTRECHSNDPLEREMIHTYWCCCYWLIEMYIFPVSPLEWSWAKTEILGSIRRAKVKNRFKIKHWYSPSEVAYLKDNLVYAYSPRCIFIICDQSGSMYNYVICKYVRSLALFVLSVCCVCIHCIWRYACIVLHLCV